jgi:transcriptional regulator with XRE-family HTH domain
MTTDHHSPMRIQRLRRGLTLRELAAACAQRGVATNSSNLSKYELGKLTPRPRLRAVLAEILGLDVIDFETGRDEPTDAASADVGVHGVRGEERAVPDDLPNLPIARVEREAS